MFVFRISSAFVVVVLLSKSALFVADDSKFLEVEALGAIEKRVGKLIDEAMRHREEEEERENEAKVLAFAVRFVAARKAIVRCVDGVCGWIRENTGHTGLATRAVHVATVLGAFREAQKNRRPQIDTDLGTRHQAGLTQSIA